MHTGYVFFGTLVFNLLFLISIGGAIYIGVFAGVLILIEILLAVIVVVVYTFRPNCGYKKVHTIKLTVKAPAEDYNKQGLQKTESFSNNKHQGWKKTGISDVQVP